MLLFQTVGLHHGVKECSQDIGCIETWGGNGEFIIEESTLDISALRPGEEMVGLLLRRAS